MWVRLSGSAAIPPSTPNTNWMKMGVCTSPRSTKCAQHVPDGRCRSTRIRTLRRVSAPSRVRTCSMSRGVFLNTRSSEPRQERLFPVKAPVARLRRHRVEREVHRSHVERAHLRLCQQRRLKALVQRHHRAAAGGQVDDRVGAGPDLAAGTPCSARQLAEGRPVSGSRACRCRIAAPASAAAMA